MDSIESHKNKDYGEDTLDRKLNAIEAKFKEQDQLDDFSGSIDK